MRKLIVIADLIIAMAVSFHCGHLIGAGKARQEIHKESMPVRLWLYLQMYGMRTILDAGDSSLCSGYVTTNELKGLIRDVCLEVDILDNRHEYIDIFSDSRRKVFQDDLEIARRLCSE